MRILDPGHDYALKNLDGFGETRLTFVKRQGEMYPGNESSYEGTNMQEVIRALIDRCQYVNGQIPDWYTERAVTLLRNVMFNLEMRAAKRHSREFSWEKGSIEKRPTCPKCGHIGCEGECHA